MMAPLSNACKTVFQQETLPEMRIKPYILMKPAQIPLVSPVLLSRLIATKVGDGAAEPIVWSADYF